MEIIEIEKNLIPYEFEIVLSDRLYTFVINYNYVFDFFTVDLMLGDKVLVKGEKIVLNQIVFQSLYEDKDRNLDNEFPNDVIIPLSATTNVERITFDNLGKEVFLYVVPREALYE